MRRWLTVLLLAATPPACAAPALIEVTETPRSAHEPSLAVFSDGFVVSWYDTRDGHGEIYARSLDSDGRPNGREWRLTTTDHDAYEADVHALGSDDFVVGWYDKHAGGGLVPRLGRWSRQGTERWTVTLAASGRNTVVGVDGDVIFAAWIQNEGGDRAGVWAGWWRPSGEVAVPARRVADASRTTWNLNAAVPPSSRPGAPRALIVFDARAGTASDEVFSVDVEPGASVVTRLTADDAVSSKYPDASPSGERLAITWFDTVSGNEEVYLAIGPTARLLRADGLTAAPPRRVTNTPGHSIGAYLAWNGRRLGLAWCDDTDGQHQVYLQEFDDTARPGGAPQRLTDSAADSLIPAIRAWRGGFAVAWSEYAGSDGGHSGGRGQIAMRLIAPL